MWLTHQTDVFDLFDKLKDLTERTGASHAVHDFTHVTDQAGIVSERPFTGLVSGLSKIEALSDEPIRDGDMILSQAEDGTTTISMVFDAATTSNGRRHRMHAVDFRVHPDVGHHISY